MVSAGPSLNARSGKAFSSSADKIDVGGAVGAALGVRFGPFFGFTLSADDNIYKTSFAPEGGPALDKPLQNDLRFSVGVNVGGFGWGADR